MCKIFQYTVGCAKIFTEWCAKCFRVGCAGSHSGSCVQSPDTLPCLLNTNRPQMLSRRWWKVAFTYWNSEQTYFDQFNLAEQIICKILKNINPPLWQVPSSGEKRLQFAPQGIAHCAIPPSALQQALCSLCGGGGGFLQAWLHQADRSLARNCFHQQATKPFRPDSIWICPLCFSNLVKQHRDWSCLVFAFEEGTAVIMDKVAFEKIFALATLSNSFGMKLCRVCSHDVNMNIFKY